MKYVPELIVNGQKIDQMVKQVICTIRGTEVTLNCTYISKHELKNAYTSSFNIKVNEKDIVVTYVKVGNRVSATVYIGNVIAFSSLSMQAVFTVLSTAYSISKSALNSLYIKSNTTRKQNSTRINHIVVKETFEF